MSKQKSMLVVDVLCKGVQRGVELNEIFLDNSVGTWNEFMRQLCPIW